VLPIYATALAVGGTLLLASVVLGHHGIDHGHDFGHGPNHDGSGSVELGILAAFLSVRFWTFAFAFFGLTGIVFEKLVPHEDGRSVFAIATMTGGVVGFVAAWTITRLRGSTVTSVPSELGYVGLEAEVLLDVTPEEPGRIRVSARGSLVDLPARGEGARFATGERAVVLDVKDGVARIGPRNTESPKG
jgi:hypothetical protein